MIHGQQNIKYKNNFESFVYGFHVLDLEDNSLYNTIRANFVMWMFEQISGRIERTSAEKFAFAIEMNLFSKSKTIRSETRLIRFTIELSFYKYRCDLCCNAFKISLNSYQ
jgi:hypothetical protein